MVTNPLTIPLVLEPVRISAVLVELSELAPVWPRLPCLPVGLPVMLQGLWAPVSGLEVLELELRPLKKLLQTVLAPCSVWPPVVSAVSSLLVRAGHPGVRLLADTLYNSLNI